jgi:hypothetical protein
MADKYGTEIPVDFCSVIVHHNTKKHELPCKNETCGSTVFIDDKVCWNCRCENPGALTYVEFR